MEALRDRVDSEMRDAEFLIGQPAVVSIVHPEKNEIRLMLHEQVECGVEPDLGMENYPFLVLCILMAIPAFTAGVLRRDLVLHMTRMALISLPFAFTEFMFYPYYWDPPFLFDAAEKFAFGVEDFLFVATLGALSIGLFPAITRKQLQRVKPQATPQAFLKMAILTAFALLGAAAGWLAGFPAIYTGVVIMLAIPSVVLLISRSDLWRHACMSGGTALLAYTGACMALELILPGTFERYWHTENLLNAFAGPLPVEELLYGFSTGFAVAVIYPFAFGLEYRRYSK